jgi:hypothetical protein
MRAIKSTIENSKEESRKFESKMNILRGEISIVNSNPSQSNQLKDLQSIKREIENINSKVDKMESVKNNKDLQPTLSNKSLPSSETKIKKSIVNNDKKSPIIVDKVDEVEKIVKEVKKLTTPVKKPLIVKDIVKEKARPITINDELKIPLSVTIKKSIKKETTYAPKKPSYNFVGIIDSNIYFQQGNDVVPYMIGENLPGYGKILSVNNKGVIKTASGVVKLTD